MEEIQENQDQDVVEYNAAPEDEVPFHIPRD